MVASYISQKGLYTLDPVELGKWELVVGGGDLAEYQIRFLMFRPDVAEVEMGGAQGSGAGSGGR